MEEEKAPPSPVPGPSSAPDVIADNAAVAKEDGDEGVLRDEDLGVQVYERDAFEAKVMSDVDREMERRQREAAVERCRKELVDSAKKVAEVVEKMRKAEEKLQKLHEKDGGGGRRGIMSVLDEMDRLRSRKEEIEDKREETVAELKGLGEWERVRGELGLEESKASEVETSESALEKDEEEAETEQEKAIRLGEMTAFGKSLKSRRESDHKADKEFERYFKDQMKMNTVSEEDRKGWESKRRREKKKKSKEREVERYDNEEEGDDEDQPGNGTDDSDWDSSGDERQSGRGKQRRRRAVDDGDRQEYLDRLSEWHEGSESGLSDTKFERLEGGLQVPSSIWDALYNYQKVCVQWLWELHQQKVGGILGDEMGLGKTIQIIAFLAAMSFSQRKLSGGRRFGPVLVVCPTTVMHQWVKEFHKWWPLFRVVVLHESGSHRGSRSSLVRSIAAANGILVCSYSGVVAHRDELLGHNFDYVVLDEGHKIRNPDAQVTLAAKSFPTAHRLILSGSPLQNNLKELWSLFDFIFPGKLGTLPVFLQQFAVPITQGGYANASRVQVATAYKCATVLRETINPYLLRRMKSDVKQMINLPEKNEQVLFCRLTDEQRAVYKSYIESGDVKNILDGRFKVFVGLINLRKICNHPDLYDGGPKHFGIDEEDEALLPDDETYGYWRKSGKMIVTEALLKLWKRQGHRVLLFTQSRKMLVVLQRFVESRGYTYMKMDGSTSVGARQPLVDKFNASEATFVFLLTTKVGGLGVNLTGASRVVIFDPDWNPSTDTQARERAWRIGQKKQVTIYRLMTSGTIEEKIYHRQIFKQYLVNRVLKDPKQRRFFKSNDLYELFTLNEGTSDRTETSAIFAGTGSDVKVDGRKKSARKNGSTRGEENNHMRPQHPASFKPRRREEKSSQRVKEAVKRLYEVEDDEGKKSQKQNDKEPKSERERLMEKVRAISKRIGNNAASGSGRKGESRESPPRKRRKKERRGKFEGHKVSHLVKTGAYKPKADGGEEGAGEEQEEGAAQDNYVLSKLFQKSGVHSALRHDVIVGDGGGDTVADYELVETEAERVAKEAVDSLRASRRQCFRAEAGVPTWTGQSGEVARSKRPRFGRKSRGRDDDNHSAKLFSGGKGNSSSSGSKLLSSSDLLAKMRERNRFLANGGVQREANGDDGESGLFRPDNAASSSSSSPSAEESQNLDLLADIRNFVAFQASVDGRASTYEIVERFHERLPPQKSPLFKALLNEICSFRRDGDGKGIWTLRPEFS